MLKNIKLQFLSLVEYFRTFSWKKFLNNLKTYFSKPQNIITIVFAIVLLVGVIFPLATMVLDSFKVQSLTEAKTMNDSWNLSLKKGDYTWALWPYVLFNPRRMDVSATLFWVPLYQSLLMALLACFIAVVIGGALAFFVTRTNLPLKNLFLLYLFSLTLCLAGLLRCSGKTFLRILPLTYH